MFSDTSESSKQSTDSSSDNTSKGRNNKSTLKKKKKKRLSNQRLCYQALNMIKFLGTIHMKKLDSKYEPRLRRIAFLE